MTDTTAAAGATPASEAEKDKTPVAPPAPAAAPARASSVANTALVASSGASGGIFLIYLLKCWATGHMVEPDETTAISMVGTLAPMFHQAWRVFGAIGTQLLAKRGITLPQVAVAASMVVALLGLSACGTMPTTAAPAPSTTTDPLATVTTDVNSAVAQALAPTSPVQKFLTAVETTGPAKIDADLTAAGLYAQSKGELLGATCFPALKTWFDALPPLPAGQLASNIESRPPPVGGFTALEYATVDRMQAQSTVTAWETQVQTIIAAGFPPALQQGCGGYLVNQQTFAAQMLALFGLGTAANAVAPGVGAALPGLGATAGAALAP